MEYVRRAEVVSKHSAIYNDEPGPETRERPGVNPTHRRQSNGARPRAHHTEKSNTSFNFVHYAIITGARDGLATRILNIITSHHIISSAHVQHVKRARR